MTQENIELLVKDLAGRVPYGVLVKKPENDSPGRLISVQIPCYCVIQVERNQWFFDEYDVNKQVVKPYLRPMSSMTEEEKADYHFYCETVWDSAEERYYHYDTFKSIDWLNEHHFDYRIDPSTGKTLIESGLALEAPEGMYA